MIFSGCVSQPPLILHAGDCERGIVTEENIQDVRKAFPSAQQTDVLISGACYYEKYIMNR